MNANIFIGLNLPALFTNAGANPAIIIGSSRFQCLSNPKTRGNLYLSHCTVLQRLRLPNQIFEER